MVETYYDVLGVSRDATGAEITAAYRERVLETHPDHNDDPDAAAQFTRVQKAEAVLTDDDERARYDRLGHEAYLGQESAGGDDDADAGRSDDLSAAAARAAERTANEERGPSHHARHRARRRRAAAHADRAAWFGRRAGGSDPAADATAGTAGTGRGTDGDRSAAAADAATGAAAAAAATTGTDADADVGYSVHDWGGDVDAGDDRSPLARSTVIAAGAVAVSYPVFVYASLAPSLPLGVAAFVAACALVLVGYLLTVPRFALAAFGTWSAVVPVVLGRRSLADPLSPAGLLALAAVWVPFGYAVAVRWAIRP